MKRLHFSFVFPFLLIFFSISSFFPIFFADILLFNVVRNSFGVDLRPLPRHADATVEGGSAGWTRLGRK